MKFRKPTLASATAALTKIVEDLVAVEYELDGRAALAQQTMEAAAERRDSAYAERDRASKIRGRVQALLD